ncbi:MAG: MBL fold metallo-hydrolase, partial [Gemmatimonadota bacterium]|nr:MBL fold metallo-hydrolase [Gemmatimonadota bacterium]
PRVNDFEDTGGPFYQDEKCLEPDPLYDDQALFFRTSQGTVVLLGCAHAGAINTLNYIRGLTGDKTIYAAAGGMHLVTAGEERLARTVEGIEELGIERLYPIHCTGFEATIRLCSSLPGKCYPCPVGTSIEFNVI